MISKKGTNTTDATISRRVTMMDGVMVGAARKISFVSTNEPPQNMAVRTSRIYVIMLFRFIFFESEI